MDEQNQAKSEKLVFRMPGVRSIRIPLFIPKPHGPLNSPLLLVYGFAVLIILGMVLLVLPFSSAGGQVTSPLTALFTATSAVCLTGLTVVDTATYWSAFGQGVLLVLIQFGGFGFITGSTLLLLIVGGKLGLRDKLFLSDSAGIDRLGGILGIIIRLAVFSVALEAIGAVLLYLYWQAAGTPDTSLWTAVFHSISAFNNCGMDVFNGIRGFAVFRLDAAVLLITALLIILGSSGYVVIEDIFRHMNFNKLSLDTKIVITATVSLLVLGTLFYFFAEYTNPATLGPLSIPQKLLAAFFQSVTPRTAGFAVFSQGNLTQIALFFTMFLMFIGGASGSTAGGLKVNTIGVLFTSALNVVRGNENISAFGRQIPRQVINRATTLFLSYLLIMGLVLAALSISETFPMDKLLFESLSALGTVGLSTGITPELSEPGRAIIIAAMFVGRLAPVTFVAFLTRQHQTANIDYPRENVRLG